MQFLANLLLICTFVIRIDPTKCMKKGAQNVSTQAIPNIL